MVNRREPLPKARKGIHIVNSPQRNPKGCKKVAGGRSPRRPPEKSLLMTAPRRGARRHNRSFSSNSIPAALSMKTWLPFGLNEGSPLFGREDDVICRLKEVEPII